MRKKSFPKPDLKESFGRGLKSIELEAHEKSMEEKFDPVSPDPVENISGVILRACAAIVRYERSEHQDPQHYRNLITSAKAYANGRMIIFAEQHPELVEEVSSTVSGLLDSSQLEAFPRASISKTVPYDGTEPIVSVVFQTEPSSSRIESP